PLPDRGPDRSDDVSLSHDASVGSGQACRRARLVPMLPLSFDPLYCAERVATQPLHAPPGRGLRLSSKEEDMRLQVREARVASGLILLVLIGILIGFVVARVRKRMGLGVTWSTWVTTVVVVGFILLLLYASSFKH